MNPEQEQTLVRSAQQGDQQALSQLWDALTPKLFGYLVNVTHDRPLAEDLLQTTWLKAIGALPNFEARDGGFSAWLFAIARNECRQHWRKAKTEAESAEPSIDERPGLQNKLLVEQLLNLLSEEDRELLRLRYIADLAIKDMARILNINSVAVRVRLHRAVARARNLHEHS